MRLAPADRERLLTMTDAEQANTWEAIEAIVAEEKMVPPAQAQPATPVGPPQPDNDVELLEPDDKMSEDMADDIGDPR